MDYRYEKTGYKIRETKNERTPYIIVVGEKEEKKIQFHYVVEKMEMKEL
jgi:threonyl-tRNA synthetase